MPITNLIRIHEIQSLKCFCFANPTNASLFGVEADVLEVVPQWENSEVGGADDGTGVEVDARQRHRLVDPGLTHNDSELAFSNT